mgnify:CR=1 FL=1
MVLTDRFSDGDTSNNGTEGVEYRPGELKYRQGGDWQGIIDNMDYIKNLGVTAIWISPPQEQEMRLVITVTIRRTITLRIPILVL